jgi:translation initiation factor 1
MKEENSRLVYSTGKGRICPECGRPASGCRCKTKKSGKAGARSAGTAGDGIVRIKREVKGRKGKAVTTVSGVSLEKEDLLQLAKDLKRRCGAGGSVKDGVVVIQGDHRQTLFEEIHRLGYPVKLAGG